MYFCDSFGNWKKRNKSCVCIPGSGSLSKRWQILSFSICKKPIYRQTPFKREIADILLAVNRAYSKSDYIPCIAWGRTARFCENMEVGTEVNGVGRVQSRQYEKKHEDGTIENKVAYEVSVGSLEVINQNDDTKQEETTSEMIVNE